MRIKDIMNDEPYVFYEDDSLLTASNFMKEEKIRNVPVIDKNNKLVGLITLREIIEGVIGNERKSIVSQAMVKEVSSVSLETPLRGAIELMLINHFGCLPVTDSDGKLLGIITETDLLKTLHDLTKIPEDFYKYYNVK